MKAFRLTGDEKRSEGALTDMERDALDPGDVLLRTHFAGLNYKDALAGTGSAPIARRLPVNAGIEAVGEVVESRSNAVQSGDMVIAHGMGLGVERDGGLAEYLRADAEWLVPLPDGLSPIEAATLGVAGFSAALAVDRLESWQAAPDGGPIAVTGASGGVGALAVAMLARRGFEVVAVSSKPDAAGRLTALGAARVVAPPEDAGRRTLAKAEWAGAVDTVGGATLAWLIATCRPGGMIASIGNAGGNDLATSVIPFILRGITLSGINANSPAPLRRRIWSRLGSDLKPQGLDALRTDLAPEDIADTMRAMIDRRSSGRSVVRWA